MDFSKMSDEELLKLDAQASAPDFSQMRDEELLKPDRPNTARPSNLEQISDEELLKPDAPDFSKMSDEELLKPDAAQEPEKKAKYGSPTWAGVKGFFGGLAEGAWAGGNAAANKIFKALPEVGIGLESAAGHAARFAGKGLKAIGSEKAGAAVESAGEWIVGDAAGAKAWLDAQFPSEAKDWLGYEDWSTKASDWVGNAAAMAVKFAPGGAKVGGEAFMESVFASDGANAFATTRDTAIANGASEAEASALGAEAALINYFGGKALMRSGGWAAGVKGAGKQFLASGAASSATMAAQGAGNRMVENLAERKPLMEGVAAEAGKGLAEGAMFHVYNAIPGYARGVMASREARRKNEEYIRGIILDHAKTDQGAAQLATYFDGTALDAAIQARKAGKKITRKMASDIGLPELMTLEEAAGVIDAVSSQRRAWAERARTQMDGQQASALAETVASYAGEDKALFESTWLKVLEKIEDARELDDPARREELVEAAMKEVSSSVAEADRIVRDYDKATNGSNVINGDTIRSQMEGFVASDPETHKKLQPRSNEIRERVFAEKLAARKGKGAEAPNHVLFTMGGPGSGKSSTTKRLSKTVDFTYDSTGANYKDLSDKIRRVIANGQKPVVSFVYCDPATAWGRAKGRVADGGHAASAGEFADMHIDARKNLERLISEFGNGIIVRVYDNTGNSPVEISLKELYGRPRYDKAAIERITRGLDSENAAAGLKGSGGGSGGEGPQVAASRPLELFKQLDEGKLPVEDVAIGDVEALEPSDTGKAIEEYDPAKAKPIVVWEGLEGNRHAVTGGKRLAMAGASGEEMVKAVVIKEADGWTEAEARSLGTTENLREGSGTLKNVVEAVDSIGADGVAELSGWHQANGSREFASMMRKGLAVAQKGGAELKAALAEGRIGEDFAYSAAQVLSMERVGEGWEAAQRELAGLVGKVGPEELEAVLWGLKRQLAEGTSAIKSGDFAAAIAEERAKYNARKGGGEGKLDSDQVLIETADGELKTLGEMEAESGKNGLTQSPQSVEDVSRGDAEARSEVESKTKALDAKEIAELDAANGTQISKIVDFTDAIDAKDTARKDQHRHKQYVLAKTSDFLKGLGIKGERFTIATSVIKKHHGKNDAHLISADEWVEISNSLSQGRPLAVTRYVGDNGTRQNAYRIWTEATIDGRPAVVGVEVKSHGKDLFVNAVDTVFRADKFNPKKELRVYPESEQEFQSVLDGLNSRKYPETPAAFDGSLPNKPMEVNAAEAPELAAAEGAGANRAVELRPIQGRDGAFGTLSHPNARFTVDGEGKIVAVEGLTPEDFAPGRAEATAALVARIEAYAVDNGLRIGFRDEATRDAWARMRENIKAEGKEAYSRKQMEERRNTVVDRLTKSGLATEVVQTKGDFDRLVTELNGRPLTAGEQVYGFCDVATGKVYLNPDFFATRQGLDAPIHEFGHLGIIAAEKVNKAVYDRGMKLAEELLGSGTDGASGGPAPGPKTGVAEIVDFILNDEYYSKRSRQEQAEELLAQLIGKRGEAALRAETNKTVVNKIKSWLVEFWNTFGKALGLKDITPEEAAKMTVEQVADAIRAEMMSGRKYGEGLDRVEFGDGGARIATKPVRIKRKLTGRRKAVNEFVNRMGGEEDPANVETDLLALWVDNGGRLFDAMPFQIETNYSSGKTGVKTTRRAVADEFAESTAFYQDLDAAQRKVFFGSEKLEMGPIGEGLKNKLKEAGITRFTNEDGTVDFDAVIDEFKRQWTNYERGEEVLKERNEWQEERDRAFVEEMERAERAAYDEISAEEAAARAEMEAADEASAAQIAADIAAGRFSRGGIRVSKQEYARISSLVTENEAKAAKAGGEHPPTGVVRTSRGIYFYDHFSDYTFSVKRALRNTPKNGKLFTNARKVFDDVIEQSADRNRADNEMLRGRSGYGSDASGVSGDGRAAVGDAGLDGRGVRQGGQVSGSDGLHKRGGRDSGDVSGQEDVGGVKPKRGPLFSRSGIRVSKQEYARISSLVTENEAKAAKAGADHPPTGIVRTSKGIYIYDYFSDATFSVSRALRNTPKNGKLFTAQRKAFDNEVNRTAASIAERLEKRRSGQGHGGDDIVGIRDGAEGRGDGELAGGVHQGLRPLPDSSAVHQGAGNNRPEDAAGRLRWSRSGIFTGTAADYANRSRKGGEDDGPSLVKIGTGEGSQVYGWGLRGTTIRKNAERDSFGKRQKNLYKQTFFTNRAPGDESHLLDWNGTTTLEQKQWFADEANKEFGGNWMVTERGLREGDGPRFDDDTGWKLYDIAKMLVARNKYAAGRVEQLASEFLARAGIDGVKAPDIRYGKASDKDELGNIYVSFRDDNIRVDHKWTDGQMRFSRAGKRTVGYTAPDGSAKPGYLKAPNGNDSRLDERQWNEVRTESYGKWFGDWQSKIRRDKLDAIKPMKVRVGAISARDGLSAAAAAKRWFAKNVGSAEYNTEVGKVVIDGRSIHDSLAHKYSQAKLDAVTTLKDGFATAVYIGSGKDIDGKPLMNHYFAYPIQYGSERRIVFCRAREDAQKNRLYLHEVFVEKNLSDSLQTAALPEGRTLRGGIALMKSILNRIYTVKGEDVSQVVDENGEPLVVYHGTEKTFWSFSNQQIGSHTDAGHDGGVGLWGRGHYFTSNRSVAEGYARGNPDGRTMAVYLNIQNPMGREELLRIGKEAARITEDRPDDFYREYQRLIDESVQKNGYDGAIVNNKYSTEYVVFEPNQIKSATDNIGTFDPGNNDIRFSRAKAVSDANGNESYKVESNGKAKRYKTPKEALEDFIKELDGQALNEEQQGIYDVVTGVKNTADIRKNDLGELVKFHKGGRGKGAGKIIAVHYAGKRGKVTAKEVIDIGQVIRSGTLDYDGTAEHPYSHTYTATASDGAELKVVIDLDKKGNEAVINFYSDRKTGNGGQRPHPVSTTTSSSPQSIPNSGAGAQGGVKLSRSGGKPPEAELVQTTRVADDAGVGEQTPGAIAASRELSRQGAVPLTTKGTRYVSLPLSEMRALNQYLTGHAMPDEMQSGRKIGAPGKASMKNRKLMIAADVLGTVDKSDMAAEKAMLQQHGFFRNEDAQWAANHTKSEIRQERERSDAALSSRLEALSDRRVHGKEPGVQMAATRVYADQLAKIVMAMPHGQPGVLGAMQTVAGALEKRVRGSEAEAEAFLNWMSGQALTSGQAPRSAQERKAEMFAAFLMMPKEMEARAKGWYDGIRSTIAGDKKLAEAFRKMTARMMSEQGYGHLQAEIMRAQDAQTEAAIKKLNAEANEPIKAGDMRARATEAVVLSCDDRMGAAIVRVNAATRNYLAAQKLLMKQAKTPADRAAIKQQTDRFIGEIAQAKNQVELSRTAWERGHNNVDARYLWRVVDILNEATVRDGLKMSDISLYLDQQRVIETKGLSGSRGESARQAQIILDAMKKRLGGDYAKIEAFARKFHAIHEQELLNDPALERVLGKGTVEYWKSQTHYVTTKRQHSPEELAEIEAARRLVGASGKFGGDTVVGQMYKYCTRPDATAKLKGSFADKQEVMSATLEKVAAIKKWVRRNDYVIELRDLLVKANVEGVHDFAAGKNEFPNNRRYGSISYMENGQKRTLVVPREIADGFRAQSMYDNAALKLCAGVNNIARQLWIDWNPVYWQRNISRNAGSIEMNMPGMREAKIKRAIRFAFPGLAPVTEIAMTHLVRHMPEKWSMPLRKVWGEHTALFYAPKAKRMAMWLTDHNEMQRRLWDAERRGDLGAIQEMEEDRRDMLAALRANMLVGLSAGKASGTAGFLDESVKTVGKTMQREIQDAAKKSTWRKALETANIFSKNAKQQVFEDVLAKFSAYLHDRAQFGKGNNRTAEESGLMVKKNVSIGEGERKGGAAGTVQAVFQPFWNMVEKGVVRNVKAYGERTGETMEKAAWRIAPMILHGLIGSGAVAAWILKANDDDEEKVKAGPMGDVYRYLRETQRAYQNCSNYVRNNYHVTPLMTDGYTSVILGMPLTDEERLLKPVARFVTDAASVAAGTKASMDVAGFMSDATGVIAPDFKMAGALPTLLDDTVHALMENPTDYYTGGQKYDKDLHALRNESWGMRGRFLAAMGKRLWNDFGGRNVLPVDRAGVDNGLGRAPGWVAKMVNDIPLASPILRSFVKIQVGSPRRDAAEISEAEARRRAIGRICAKDMFEKARREKRDISLDPVRYGEMLDKWQKAYGLTPDDMAQIEARYLNAWRAYEGAQFKADGEREKFRSKAEKLGLDAARIWLDWD